MSTNAIPGIDCTTLNQEGEYNKGLQIVAVLVIFAVSSTGALLPVLSTRFPRLKLPQKVLFVFKHFGTGVLIATSFCHLLPTAFGSLLSPCLDQNSIWGNYQAMTGLISMLGLFTVVGVQLLFAEIHGSENFHHHRSEIVDGPPPPPREPVTLLPAHTGHVADGKSPAVVEKQQVQIQQGTSGSLRDDQSSVDSMTRKERRAEEQAAFLKVVMLELGILFHSVFIGMALSVSKGSGFVILFVAIIFHQTFEGLSLGTRIALLKFHEHPESTKWFIPRSHIRPYIMGALYGLTTPLGQAIGLILLYSPGTSYDPGSATALILIGVMNAISGGLLLWASLVELLAADFLGAGRTTGLMREKKYRILAWCSVLAGAGGMAVVGAWA